MVNDKNEVISFMMVGYLNNIWSSLYYKKVTNLSIVKLFVYLCSKINIKCDIVSNSISGNLANKVYIGNSFLVVDLFKDLANIKGNFMTEYFDKYNSWERDNCTNCGNWNYYSLDNKNSHDTKSFYLDLGSSKNIDGIDYNHLMYLKKNVSTTSDQYEFTLLFWNNNLSVNLIQ